MLFFFGIEFSAVASFAGTSELENFRERSQARLCAFGRRQWRCGTIWGVSHSRFRQRRVNGVDKVYYAEICLWPEQSVQHRKKIWTDIARWTSRRRHRYLFIASKAHIRVDNSRRCAFFFLLLLFFSTGGASHARATRNKRASYKCGLCQVSVNARNRIILSPFASTLTAFSSHFICHCVAPKFLPFLTHALRQHFAVFSPFGWKCLVAVVAVCDRSRKWRCTLRCIKQTTRNKTHSPHTAIRYRKDFGKKLPRDAETCSQISSSHSKLTHNWLEVGFFFALGFPLRPGFVKLFQLRQ